MGKFRPGCTREWRKRGRSVLCRPRGQFLIELLQVAGQSTMTQCNQCQQDSPSVDLYVAHWPTGRPVARRHLQWAPAVAAVISSRSRRTQNPLRQNPLYKVQFRMTLNSSERSSSVYIFKYLYTERCHKRPLCASQLADREWNVTV